VSAAAPPTATPAAAGVLRVFKFVCNRVIRPQPPETPEGPPPWAAFFLVTDFSRLISIKRLPVRAEHSAPRDGSAALAIGAADHVHQLGDLAALLGLVARGDRAFDAVGDMIAQNFLLRAS
jgi:hypothetical protein